MAFYDYDKPNVFNYLIHVPTWYCTYLKMSSYNLSRWHKVVFFFLMPMRDKIEAMGHTASPMHSTHGDLQISTCK